MQRLPFAQPDIGPLEIDGVVKCLRSGWLTGGGVVREFEQQFADFLGVKHAIAVSSATMGALLVLDTLGVGPGDEVIFPTYTFSGPAMMAHRLGAKVVLADCAPGSYNIDCASISGLFTSRTKAVVPTHFAGSACNMDELSELCLRKGVHLVDDAAHAFPTVDWSTNAFVGSGLCSSATFFSFYATKPLTTGEGGMVTTNIDGIAKKVRQLRLHGFDRELFDRYTNPRTGWSYDIAAPGWKANMTDIAAAIGIGQLGRSAAMRAKRAAVASTYFERLRDVPGLFLPEFDGGSSWHLFPIQVSERDRFVRKMGEAGVQCSVHFIPLHRHSYWKGALGFSADLREFPCADSMFECECSLPIYSTMSDEDVDFVCETVLKVRGVK